MYSGFLTFFSIFLRILNLKLLVKVKHKTRIKIVFLLAFLGLSLLIYSLIIKNFICSLLGTISIGLATTLGDLTVSGHLKSFAPIIFSGYSSGTGFAGVFGASYYFACDYFGVSYYITFSFLLLLYIVYIITFYYLIHLGNLLAQMQHPHVLDSMDSDP